MVKMAAYPWHQCSAVSAAKLINLNASRGGEINGVIMARGVAKWLIEGISAAIIDGVNVKANGQCNI
jgi:hypothetical protein